jgi:superfamily II DNA helicase RecQ
MLIKEATATPIDYLRTAVGRDDATFRDEQLECIEAAVRGERLLVVQRTGWGKSIVYFIATRLLRDRGAGATLIVSPLLSLMRNQLAAAGRIGLRPATINSANTEDWDAVPSMLGAYLRLFWPEYRGSLRSSNRLASALIPGRHPHRTTLRTRRIGIGDGVSGRSFR